MELTLRSPETANLSSAKGPVLRDQRAGARLKQAIRAMRGRAWRTNSSVAKQMIRVTEWYAGYPGS